MKTLVVIANFGTKNEKYLKRVLEEYRAMKKYEIDIVVLSDIPKNLGPGIEVIVGLPTKDPWSLPYGHKMLFAERMERYELFIYSEDDTLITGKNIDLFIETTQILPNKYISGFIRYEILKNGMKYYPDFHNRFHWDPNSVFEIAGHVFAHHTNEHSACFILTQRQLKSAINSGGFLLPPRIGRYDMLVTAATDPYTQCGIKKLICISHLDDACVHHLPNAYVDKMGQYAEWGDQEIERLKAICGKDAVRGPLFDTNTLMEDAGWEKKYYEPIRKDILSIVPKGVQRVLSVGCCDGLTESELVKEGIEVIGIPLDCVIKVIAEAKGIKMVSPNFQAAMNELQGEEFNCILFSDVLQHWNDPISMVRNFLNLLGENGVIIISVPNFHYPSVVRKKMFWRLLLSNVNKTRSFERYKLHFTTRRLVDGWLKNCEMKVVQTSHHVEPSAERVNHFTIGMLKGLLSKNVVVQCKRTKIK